MYISAWPGLRLRDAFPIRRTSKPPYPLNADHQSHFHIARGGIYHLFRALAFTEKDTVLAPDYHSGSEIAAIHAAGAKVRFYPIRRDFEPDLGALAELARKLQPRVIYVIHYLGWPQPLKCIQAICAEYGSLLVEDCALAFLSGV